MVKETVRDLSSPSSSVNTARADGLGHEHNDVLDGKTSTEEEEEEHSDSSNDSSSEDDDDEDDDEEEDEEDEDPPALKYTRLTQLPKTFFNKELVSAISINETCFCFGTSSGLLHVTNPDFSTLGTVRARKSPILAVHCDMNYVVAASMDGTILIANLAELQNPSSTTAYDLKTPIYSVVLNRDYKTTRSFIYGTKSGKVVLSHTNWLGTRNERTLASDRGPIVKMEIIGNVLIWFSDEGVTFWDLRTESVVSKISRPKGANFPAELCWPRVCFPEHDRMLIGWGDHIWLVKCDDGSESNETNFKLSSAMSTFSKPVAEAHVSIEFEMKLPDGVIAGIASLKGDLIILTVNSSGKITEPPELRIINSVTHEETITDEIVLKGYQQLRINDLHLGQFVGKQAKFFIVCSTEGIVAEEFDLMGRYNWYMEKRRYLQAWEMSEHLISTEERCNVGIKQVQVYLEDENWPQATSFLKQVLDKCEQGSFLLEKWEQWCWIFIHAKKIELLATILPTVGPVDLPSSIYDKCLEYFLEEDNEKLFHYMAFWDPAYYDYEHIQQLIDQKLELEPELPVLRRALANSYLQTDFPMKAVKHFIHLKDPQTIDILSKHHLTSHFVDEIPSIIKFTITKEELDDAPLSLLSEKLDSILSILVDQRHEILPERLLHLFDKTNLRVVSFLYLQRITAVDSFMAEPYETELMTLFAEYAPTQLLGYLKKAQHYDMDVALEITRQRELYPELVHLLGRVGKTAEAMYLIIDKLDDPDMAIEFARSQNDDKLWDIFLDNGINKPRFIKTLLQHTGTLFDGSVLKRIPEGVEIEGLKDSLERIMKDNELMVVIHKVILQIIDSDGQGKAHELNDLRWRGKLVDIKEWSEKMALLQDGKVVPYEQLNEKDI